VLVQPSESVTRMGGEPASEDLLAGDLTAEEAAMAVDGGEVTLSRLLLPAGDRAPCTTALAPMDTGTAAANKWAAGGGSGGTGRRATGLPCCCCCRWELVRAATAAAAAI